MVFPVTGALHPPQISTRNNDVVIFKYEAHWITYLHLVFLELLPNVEKIVFMDSFYLPLRCCFLKFHEEAWGETGWSCVWRYLMLQFITHIIPAVFSLMPPCVILWHTAGGVLKRKKQQMWLQLPGRLITSIPCAIKQKQGGNGASAEGGVQRASEWMFTDADMFRTRSTITNPSDSPSIGLQTISLSLIFCKGNLHHPSVLRFFLQNWRTHHFQ